MSEPIDSNAILTELRAIRDEVAKLNAAQAAAAERDSAVRRELDALGGSVRVVEDRLEKLRGWVLSLLVGLLGLTLTGGGTLLYSLIRSANP